ncbi:hypothetical protein RRG08_047643 [Elysia crispata]|uniref:Uncharacterized protein n=1 Tax=Elysia crispata TaxID=231223 RepID=A0AAE0ZQW4_9GAST|nr:hypothetical protein RRG08_047643 [Elysia crispata]
MSKWADINVSSHKIYYQLTFSVNFVTQSFPAVKSTHTRGYTHLFSPSSRDAQEIYKNLHERFDRLALNVTSSAMV